MSFETYLQKGLVKKQNVNFKQTEAGNACETASQLIRLIEEMIRTENPQLHFGFD